MWQRARPSSGVYDIHWPVWTAPYYLQNGAPRYRLPCWKVRSVVCFPWLRHSEAIADNFSRQRREDHTLGPIYHRRSLRSDRFHRYIGWDGRLSRSCAPRLGSVADLGTFLLQQHAVAFHQHHRNESGEVSCYAGKPRAKFSEMNWDSAWNLYVVVAIYVS